MSYKKIFFKNIIEMDGSLTFLESKSDIPFDIKRVFLIYNVPTNEVIRANHASINTCFVLQLISGYVNVELDDGTRKEIFTLANIREGLYVPSMTWMKTTHFSCDAILQVYASETYDDCIYIDDYEEFIGRCGKQNEENSNFRGK